ncbi:DUF7661 family protein [Thalassomonas actiniarum]|uniref:DUF7661 domain-containing protein n=1 Tax=Thalassomonas actiniarum TaxID=485447 RepID=A0AAE9YS01_9GAMM|nr:hypothetical protein [Thalassomonas actiniarum]WDD99990.1 hypothetical protein SG35_004830 [Thalassomonas actiniarum]
MVIKFNVFGKQMSVHRIEQHWQLFNDSDTGMSARVYDVVIPSELTPDELAGYLDDIFHEYANEKFPEVVKLT